MYKEFPDVPDFGAFSGLSLEMDPSVTKESTMYVYKSTKTALINDYKKLLEENGFKFSHEAEISGGNVFAYYKKGSAIVAIGIAFDLYTAVVVFH